MVPIVVSTAEAVPTYSLEDCPFETVMVNVTHKCNMTCANCYIPDRTPPDVSREWLLDAFRRLRPRRYVRLVGAEPTMRADLTTLVRDVRSSGHHPVLMTNGLKLASRAYVQELKRAGLQVAYLSMNGAFDNEIYLKLDGARCASHKARAFSHLRDEHIYTSIGMIVVPGMNEHAVGPLLRACMDARNVRELHLRSVGKIGRHMTRTAFDLDGLMKVFEAASRADGHAIEPTERTPTSVDFRYHRLRVQLTQWPDLRNPHRGQLTNDSRVAPFFEHVMTNMANITHDEGVA